MSEPSVVSEKAVWLEENMPKWLVYCNIEASDDIHDVMSVILAHLSPRGIEELHLLVSELFEEDELFCNQINLIHGEPGFTKKVRQAEKDLERLDIRPEMEDNPS